MSDCNNKKRTKVDNIMSLNRKQRLTDLQTRENRHSLAKLGKGPVLAAVDLSKRSVAKPGVRATAKVESSMSYY